MNLRIGIDGGGTKTECVLIDAAGTIIAQHTAPGSNPNIVGAEPARTTVASALMALRSNAPTARITHTLLCMAGDPAMWREFAATLNNFGQVVAMNDSHPVLELATGGQPGLVLHAGTGSFVAARAPDGSIHYAGGLGWRFGDAGSGYEIGRRAIGRALLDLQGWSPAPRLTEAVRQHAGMSDAPGLVRLFYREPNPNARIGELAPTVLKLADDGDAAALEIVSISTCELLALALKVAGKLFPEALLPTVRGGLSGAILTHPVVTRILAAACPFPLLPVQGAPIEGVRRMLARM